MQSNRRSQWSLGRGGLRSGLATLLCVGAAAIAVAGCSELTEVGATDVIEPGSLENTEGALALRAGVLALFAREYTGSQILTSASIADEIFATHTSVSADQRSENASGMDGLHPVRVNALLTLDVLEKVGLDPWMSGELLAIVGYTEVFFGESLCSGVPLSAIVAGRPVFGEPLTTVQMFEQAVSDFESALAAAAGNERIEHLARIGQARALLNLGRFSEAAAAVAGVPTDFVYATEYSVPAQPNAVYRAFHVSQHLTVADREGINGLPFRSAEDPRVQTIFLTDQAYDGTPVYATLTQHATETSPADLATGVEARLIEAEALLQAGDATGALNTLNELRAGVNGLEPLDPEPSAEARVDQLFRERAFWLFLTGHRHGDLRRLIRQYDRSPEAVFPTGPYKPGLEYRSAVTLRPSDSELSNPNYQGCLDRDA